MRKFVVSIFLVMLLGSFMIVVPAAADTYTTLTLPTVDANISTWSGGSAYNSIFPGQHTWNGVPFNLVNNPQNSNKVFTGGYSNASLTIPVNVYGVTKAYTIINSSWGNYGTTVGTIEFIGTGGADYKVNLVEGTYVRDHYNGSFNNIINSNYALSAFSDPSGARLDMQLYTLPAIFAHQTLSSIVFTTYFLGNPSGNPFIAAATVQSPVPLPGTAWLLASGLLGLGALRRFRKG